VKIDEEFEKGKTVTFTFTKPDTHKFHCEYHPHMHGTIETK
jgi:plastocyanin